MIKIVRLTKMNLADAGMTLVETLVVLAIMALAAAMSLPRIAISDNTKLAVIGSELAAELRTSRAMAVSRSEDVAFRLNTAKRTIWSAAIPSERNLPPEIDATLLAARDYLREADTGSIIFFADGSSTGGTLLLRKGNSSRTIRIDWLSGRVEHEG